MHVCMPTHMATQTVFGETIVTGACAAGASACECACARGPLSTSIPVQGILVDHSGPALHTRNCCLVGGAGQASMQETRGGGNGEHRIPSNRTAQCTSMSCTDLNDIADTNSTALTVADAFQNIPDAARRRRRVITTCNAIGVAYLTEMRSRQSEKEAGVVGAALSDVGTYFFSVIPGERS